jgi:hypothetical protein
MKKIAFFATDKSPSDVFERVAHKLVTLGYQVDGRTNTASSNRSPYELVSWADVIVTGMSNNEKRAFRELEAINFAKEQNKPVFIFADNYDIAGRPFFAKVMSGVTLGVPDESERKKYSEKYPDTKVVITGDPITEERVKLQIDEEKVREELGLRGKTILIAGLKETYVNMSMIETTLTAIYEYGLPISDVIYVMHGQEMKENLGCAEIYARMRVELEKQGLKIFRFFDSTTSDQRVTEILKVSDMLISRAAGLDRTAVYWRKPVADLFTFFGLQRYRNQTGSSHWRLSEQGVTRKVKGIDDLGQYIKEFLCGEDFLLHQLQGVQESMYPLSDLNFSSVDRIISYLV